VNRCPRSAPGRRRRLVLRLETVRRAHRGAAFGGLLRRQLEPQREVGLAALLHPGFQLRQHRPIEAAPATLVGEGGVGEAVTQHGLAAFQRGQDVVHEVITPRREHQQRFGQRLHRLVQHEAAQRLGQRRAAGLAREQHAVAVVAQPRGHRIEVRALAGAVDAFDGDEAARSLHDPPRWYLFTARL
jgi:hypothetical protein